VSASSALQGAIYDALQADVPLAALVDDRVYDVPPEGATYPYVSFGPSTFVTERRDCFKSRTETIQVDVWTANQMRRQPCKAIMDAVCDVLDQGNLSLADPYGLARMDLIFARIMDDPNGIARHGILQFSCEVTGG
jgi:hypothetical protein